MANGIHRKVDVPRIWYPRTGERRATQHERYGVINPSSDDAKDPEVTGKRITLRDENDEILADFIIGNPAGSIDDGSENSSVSDQPQDDYYYVRVPGEKETYKTKIDIDLSTKFSDWIEPDLLKLEKGDIRKLEIDNYQLVNKMISSPQGFQIQQAKEIGEVQQLSLEELFGY